jgi:hyperosmotically inducible protein
VKAALLREPQLKSLDVSVETYRGEVLLSGFVKDETQRSKAVKTASTIAGVTGVKDGLLVRN